MHSKIIDLFVLIIILSILLFGCSSSKIEGEDQMSEEELAKLDPMLQKVFREGEQIPSIVAHTTDEDGTVWISVVIRTTDAEEVRALGLNTGAQVGNLITAQVNREQIRQLLGLQSVEYIEAGMMLELQKRER